jgi:hypothetical protein
MFRADIARDLGGFNSTYDPFSQDYDLWCRLMHRHAAVNLSDRLVKYRVSGTSIIGSLDAGQPANDYQKRFERGVRELTAQQARRVLGADAVSDADATLIAGFALGLDASAVSRFLSMFERLLLQYSTQHADCGSSDFRVLLARQFEALAFRVRPATRESMRSIYFHAFRRHPEILMSFSQGRMLAALLLGRSGRDWLARWKRRSVMIAKS